MHLHQKVYVVNWNKRYSTLTKWNQDTQKRENIFPIQRELPDYCGIEHHWKFVYEPNYTKKGTINKREPKKLVEKIPVYENYKWEILEIFKHPNAGEWYYPERDDRELYGKYYSGNLFLLGSLHTDKDWMKCYIVVEEEAISELTPEQYLDMKFNALIESNFGKWNRNNIDKNKIPKEIISKFYDSDDNVLFGSQFVKGLVSYSYLEGKYSVDGKPIYLYNSILYDGKGNSEIKDKSLIRDFNTIKKYLES